MIKGLRRADKEVNKKGKYKQEKKEASGKVNNPSSAET